MKSKNRRLEMVTVTDDLDLWNVPFVMVEADQDLSTVFIEDSMTDEEALESVFDEVEEE